MLTLTTADVMLIKLLTDMIVQAVATLKQIGTMTEEQVKAAIPVAEQASKDLQEKLKAH